MGYILKFWIEIAFACGDVGSGSDSLQVLDCREWMDYTPKVLVKKKHLPLLSIVLVDKCQGMVTTEGGKK